jgi:Peptidase family M48
MSNTQQLLFLHLVQAKQSLERAKNNCYSDRRKEQYQNLLFQLYNAVEQHVKSLPSSYSDSQVYDGPKRHLGFIFKSLEFLDSSTLNQIPYEIVECLNHAMEEWLDPIDKYIIVTSLVTNIEQFSYDPSIAFDDSLFSDIKTRYGIDFTHRLIQISLPKTLSRDYLASVVLYHELGHFIDFRHSVTKSIALQMFLDIYKKTVSAQDFAELGQYFPYWGPHVTLGALIPSNSDLFVVTLNHLQEYFCDLFAAQYIGETSNFYLTYMTEGQTVWFPSHPSTVNRVKVVTDYVNVSPNIVVTLINQALFKIRKTKIQKRYLDVPTDDFVSLVPTTVGAPPELHGLISRGWDLWLNQQSQLTSVLGTTEPLKIYSVINNLIEKSIGNYITENKWNKAQQARQTTTPTAPPAPALAAASVTP